MEAQEKVDHDQLATELNANTNDIQILESVEIKPELVKIEPYSYEDEPNNIDHKLSFKEESINTGNYEKYMLDCYDIPHCSSSEILLEQKGSLIKLEECEAIDEFDEVEYIDVKSAIKNDELNIKDEENMEDEEQGKASEKKNLKSHLEQQEIKCALIKFTFSRRYFFEIWTSVSGSITNKQRHVLEVLLSSFDNLENIDIKCLESRILGLCKSVDIFWKKVRRYKSKFLLKYSDWLNEVECIELTRSNKKNLPDKEPQPGPSRRRPRKEFSELSKRSKRRRLAKLSQVDDSAVNTILTTSGISDSNLPACNADEVLSLFVDAKLTKHQYLLIRTFVNKKTSTNILPSYQDILNAKKNATRH